MAAKKIKIRAYNVRFGDCILVFVETSKGKKHILFDFGNAPGGSGGRNDVFPQVAEDIEKQTGGTIDLPVMTHEHLDHMEGFLSQREVFNRLKIHHVWMPIMSAPDYAKKSPNSKSQKLALESMASLVQRWKAAGRLAALSAPIRSLIDNNILALTNKERIDYVRALARKKSNLHYLYRGASLKGKHSLGSEIKIEVPAPEKDSSIYYARKGKRYWLDAAARLGDETFGWPERGRGRRTGAPRHVAPDEFERLKDEVAEMDWNDILAIDKAANNTSLVVRLTIGGKVLLFSGDAEEESWEQMRARKLLGPVDLLKVAHHGSINGMPFEGGNSVAKLLLKKGAKRAPW